MVRSLQTWTLLLDGWTVTYRILGNFGTRIPSVHLKFCRRLCILLNSWTTSTCHSRRYLIVVSSSSFQGMTQNLRKQTSRSRDWGLPSSAIKIIFPWGIIPVNCVDTINLIWLSDYQLFKYVTDSDILRPFPVFSMERKFSENSCPKNTDACHVEDIDNPHTSDEWSNIFRTRSFTLCKNDLDPNEESETVTVSESISSLSKVNLSVCCVQKPGGWSLTSLSVVISSVHQISTLGRTPTPFQHCRMFRWPCKDYFKGIRTN